MTFRLALLNPNTDQRHTEAMGGVARSVLPAGCELTAVSAARGPSSIESQVDTVVAAFGVVELVQTLAPHDAYLIACFGDPALEAARELVAGPVVGIGEAAVLAATSIAKRFAIITTLPRGIPALEDALEHRGLGSRCTAVVPLEIPVADQGSEHAGTTDAIVAAGLQVVAEHGAEALILACGGMADVAATVQERVGVPVCDGVSIGALWAYSLWRCGLRTSKAGAYGWPEPIPYEGMSAPGAQSR